MWTITNRNVITGFWIPFSRFHDTLDFANVISMRKRRVRSFHSTEISLAPDLGPCTVVLLRLGTLFRRAEATGQPDPPHQFSLHPPSSILLASFTSAPLITALCKLKNLPVAPVRRSNPRMWVSMETKCEMQQKGKEIEIRPAAWFSLASCFSLSPLLHLF